MSKYKKYYPRATFLWQDGSTATRTYPESIKGLTSEGEIPILVEFLNTYLTDEIPNELLGNLIKKWVEECKSVVSTSKFVLTRYYPTAVFIWEDGNTITRTYPESIRGLTKNSKRPSSVGFTNIHPTDEIPNELLGNLIKKWLIECRLVVSTDKVDPIMKDDLTKYYPTAVFIWEDESTSTKTYPQSIRGLSRNGKRPISVEFTNTYSTEEIPSVSLGIEIDSWIRGCKHTLPITQQQPTANTEELGTFVEQIPFEGMDAMGKIFAEGAVKYGEGNWKNNPTTAYRKERCRHAIRHLMLWANGDRQEAHLAKVAWFCFTELWCQKHYGDIV